MFVQTEETPNPDSLKFMPGQEVLEARFGTGMVRGAPGRGGRRVSVGLHVLVTRAAPQHFASLSDAQHSPLAQQLLRLDGVEGVFLANEFLTVTKHSEMAWEVGPRTGGDQRPRAPASRVHAPAQDVKPDVFASLMDFFTSGQPIVKEHDQAASVRGGAGAGRAR